MCRLKKVVRPHCLSPRYVRDFFVMEEGDGLFVNFGFPTEKVLRPNVEENQIVTWTRRYWWNGHVSDMRAGSVSKVTWTSSSFCACDSFWAKSNWLWHSDSCSFSWTYNTTQGRLMSDKCFKEPLINPRVTLFLFFKFLYCTCSISSVAPWLSASFSSWASRSIICSFNCREQARKKMLYI